MGTITKNRACYQYEITNMHGNNLDKIYGKYIN